MMKELLSDTNSQDVTLVCDDKTKLKAHKIVLKACSSVFANILDDDTNPNPIIYLRDIHHQEIESILQFMYLGQATFYESRMNEFLRVANSLEVKELSQEVVAEDGSVENNFNFSRSCDQAWSEIQSNSVIKFQEDIANQMVEQTKLYSCNHCEYTSMHTGHLKFHVRSVHEGRKVPCPDCDKAFFDNSTLKRHFKKAHPPQAL